MTAQQARKLNDDHNTPKRLSDIHFSAEHSTTASYNDGWLYGNSADIQKGDPIETFRHYHVGFFLARTTLARGRL